MNEDRLFRIVMMELTNDNLKLEHELEYIINSNMEINKKTFKIKELLTKIAMIENSIIKFNSMVSIIDNNNEINKEQNGKL